MIQKVTVQYDDGSSAVFTGSPVELLSIPLNSPEQQDAATASAERLPTTPEVTPDGPAQAGLSPVAPTPSPEE